MFRIYEKHIGLIPKNRVPEPKAEAKVLAGCSRIRFTDGCVSCVVCHTKKKRIPTSHHENTITKISRR